MSPEASPLGPSLAALVAPQGPDSFIATHWRRGVFHGRGSPARLARLTREAGSTEVARLLESARHFVATGGATPGPAGSRSEALAAYAAGGTTLYFRMREDFPLCRWTEALAHDLGEPPIGVTSFFAVRGGGGTAPHLDWNENFTIQLEGTKRWRVAPAPRGFLEHPVSNWVLGDPVPPYADPTLAPAALPEDAVAYDLSPGDVLYVPRGFIHDVSAPGPGESLSLNLSFPPTPWAALLCSLLSTRLHESPELRAAINGAFGAGWGRDEALAQLPRMLAHLSAAAAGVEGDLRQILDDPARLAEYLARRRLPKL